MWLLIAKFCLAEWGYEKYITVDEQFTMNNSPERISRFGGEPLAGLLVPKESG
jgi:hypothetical protein